MDFSLDELQRGVVDAGRAFARGRLAPEASVWDASGAIPESVWRELGELGLLSICVPESLGGAGLDALALALVVEQLAQASASVAWGVVLAAEACERLTSAGGSTTQELDALMDGRRLAEACRDADAEGRLGLRGLPQGLALTSAAQLCEQARCRRQLGAAAALVGLAQAATTAALEYARERRQFGRPLAAFQAIQFKLADARTGVASARLLVQRAGASGSQVEASAALAYASGVAPEVCSESLQIHGGYGYTTDFPVERQLRDATAIALLAENRVQTRARVAQALSLA